MVSGEPHGTRVLLQKPDERSGGSIEIAVGKPRAMPAGRRFDVDLVLGHVAVGRRLPVRWRGMMRRQLTLGHEPFQFPCAGGIEGVGDQIASAHQSCDAARLPKPDSMYRQNPTSFQAFVTAFSGALPAPNNAPADCTDIAAISANVLV